MPRVTRTISIFLASPSDVSSERELVAQTISEWNQIRSRDRGTYFELLRWETNVSSGFAEDAQQVVNFEIGDEYDALIAIFWTRIGTQTPRAQSGSIEEYERALSRHQAGEPVEIAFFFKDALVSLKAIDLDQVKAVEDLKARVGREGALSKDFADQDTLRFEINLLLDKLARTLGAGQPLASEASHAPALRLPAAPDSKQDNSLTSERNEEIGYLDVVESLDRHSKMATEFLAEMTSRFERMTANNNEVTSKIEELAQLGPVPPPMMKSFISTITDGMNSFSEFLEARGAEYAEHSMGIAEDTRSLIDLSSDFVVRQDDVSALESTLIDLLSSMDGSVESIEGVLHSTEGLQRMTVAFNHAKRRLASNLRLYISDLVSTRDVVRQALDELRVLKADPPPPIFA